MSSGAVRILDVWQPGPSEHIEDTVTGPCTDGLGEGVEDAREGWQVDHVVKPPERLAGFGLDECRELRGLEAVPAERDGA